MKTIATEISFETNTLLVLQLLLKFSSNILQVEYQKLTYRLKEIWGHDEAVQLYYYKLLFLSQ